MRILRQLSFFGILCSLSLQAIEYKIDGNVVSSTRIGLSNNKTTDLSKGIYPNNSFWALSSQLGISLKLLDTEHKVTLGLKGMVGGVALDTTREGASIFPSNATSGKDSVGDFTAVYMPAWGEIINAYVTYSYKDFFGFKAGRYDFMNTDWWSGHNEGAEFFIGKESLRFYTIYTHRRSSSNLEWLNHFDARNADINRFGIFVFGVDSAFEIGNQKLSLRPYLYYQPGVYVDPGFKIVHESNKDFQGEGINFKTTFLTLFAMHDKNIQNKLSGQDWGYQALYDSNAISAYNPSGYLGRTHGEGGVTLFLREDIFIDNYNVGAGIYKNFGNANDLIGSYGDPTGLNTWVYTLYSTGPTWSDFFSQDALSGFVFGGGKYERWKWDLIGRYTYAPRSNENSIALLLGYDFTPNINLNLRLEWAGTYNKAGYKISQTYLKENIYTDKSMIFWYLSAKL